MMGDWDVVKTTKPSEWDVVSAVPAADIAVPKGRPGVRLALQELLRQQEVVSKLRTRGGQSAKSAQDEDLRNERHLNAATLGGFRWAEAGLAGGITGLQRLIPGGASPNYTAADMRDAYRLLSNAQQRRFAAQHPGVAFGTDVVGSLQMPGGKMIGDWVVGKAAPAAFAANKAVPVGERVLQGVRMATAGGALAGTQAGALADPGEEASDATEAGIAGAVLTPMVGGVAGMGIAAARRAPRLGSRIIGRGPSAEVTAVEKLQTALQRAGATPDILNKVADDWAKMGGVDPATIDLLRDANVTPEVLRLLQRSASRVESRAMAADYAKNTVDNVQPTATAQAEKLPTGAETRTPTQIRADLAAEEARIADDLVTQQTQIEADKVAATPVAPAAPLARESGAATFADDLNRLYDTSYDNYKGLFKKFDESDPSTVVVKPEVEGPNGESIDQVGQVYNTIRDSLKNRSPVASKEALNYLKSIWPMDGKLTLATLRHMQEDLATMADAKAGGRAADIPLKMKAAVDSELERLLKSDQFDGDPTIIQSLKDATAAFAEHQGKFGSGLPAKLTARKPSGEREVPANMAGDVIFNSPTQIGLNKSLNELGGSLDLVSPESIRALQEELYGRVKLSDLPALRETTGGKRLLPEDLTEAALKVPPGTQAADEAAAQAQAAVEAAAAARREPLAASESALGLGEEVLSRPTEEFAPAIGGVDEVNLGLTSTGAKQAVLDAIEGKAPGGKQPFNQMFSQRAMQNLERAVGPEAGTLRQRLDAIQRQAQNAQTLEKVVTKESSRNTSPLLENVTGANVVYRSGWVNEILDAVRKSAHLSDKEYQAALSVLTSKDPAAKQRLLDGLLKKYPKAKRAIAPLLTKALTQPGDETAVDTLEEGYGVTEP